ncbi:translation factor GUF1 homolog, mitochondrial-like [Oscarella lobularis]|uniref:translation factor GUF1 homolog, mitochondrial-like n=1 Tax=Oscarella lobularis TaxID=121494 RepID=UPI003313A4CE
MHRWRFLFLCKGREATIPSVLRRWIASKTDDSPTPTALLEFPVTAIRNFSIVAHVDHGKSTLADRILEITGVIAKDRDNKQVLDKLQVERERGITVKAQTASLVYESNGKRHLLNLVDTPGHVDFTYEVSRSLLACQGVILLVDATQGVQAQSVANYHLAVNAGLVVVPVINKIDLKHADIDRVSTQMTNLFQFEKEEILKVSAKTGEGVSKVLEAIVANLPSPPSDVAKPLKALLFDSWFDQYKGVICLIAVINGKVAEDDLLTSAGTGKTYTVTKVGIMQPNEKRTGTLFAGQVGYVVVGMRNVEEAQIGDTFFRHGSPVEPLPGFKKAKPMVFASLFPDDQSGYLSLRSAIDKLTLNDSSVSVHGDSSIALGQGFRLGFLGLLHMDVFRQRLEQEFDESVIITAPTVPFKAIMKKTGAEVEILSPSTFPDGHLVSEYREPTVIGSLIFPDDYMGKMITLCTSRRGRQLSVSYIDDTRVMMTYALPLSEIILDFYDQLKSFSSGYASFDYEESGYQSAELVKLDILLNGRPVDALASIVHKDKAYKTGKELCVQLKNVVPRQLYEVAIQAAIQGKVIARETIRALRKDVTAKLYGGDVTRKMKLLKRQVEGKKKLKMIGNVELPKEAFLAIIKR